MIALSVAKLKKFSPESEIFLWIKPKKKKKTFSCGKFGSMPTFRSTRKGKKYFLWWAYVCLTTRCYTTSHLHQVFFRCRSDFLAFFARISYFKFFEFKEFNKTIIPFVLVGYETGYSQLGATRLVGYLPSPGAHEMEPASPTQALGVNPFPSRFINRTVPWGGFALIEERAHENRKMLAGSRRIHAIQAHNKRKWFYL